MKYWIIILSIFLSNHINAKCRYNGIYILSPSAVLTQKPFFLLEFSHSSQSLIKDLNKKFSVYLKSNGNKISLVIMEILKGDMETTQVVFRCDESLQQNNFYKLIIDNLPKGETIDVICGKAYSDNKKFSWSVSNQINIDKPLQILNVAETKKTRELLGCGPSEWVYFNIDFKNDEPVFVRANVKHISTGKITTFLLSIENKVVSVGRGMCGGLLSFDDSNDYEITFSLVSTSGKAGDWYKPILFSRPNRTGIPG